MAKGGKRAGAGRKPSTLKGLVKKLGKFDAEALLAKINQNQKWQQLANSEDQRIVLETLKYLSDRAYGKAKQTIEGAGANGEHLVVIRHSIPRPVQSGSTMCND